MSATDSSKFLNKTQFGEALQRLSKVTVSELEAKSGGYGFKLRTNDGKTAVVKGSVIGEWEHAPKTVTVDESDLVIDEHHSLVPGSTGTAVRQFTYDAYGHVSGVKYGRLRMNDITDSTELAKIESVVKNGSSASDSRSLIVRTVIRYEGEPPQYNYELVETSALLNPYALKNSPAFTGTPTAPTPAAGDNSTKLATTAFVMTALGSITGIEFQVVASYAELPSPGRVGTIYLVPHSHGRTDIYDEYVFIVPGEGQVGSYEKIGNTDIDLSGYWAKEDLVAITAEEVTSLLNQYLPIPSSNDSVAEAE